MYIGVARSSYRQHSCDDVTKLGLCDWFTNELTDWRRRRRRKEITYETLGLLLVQKLNKPSYYIILLILISNMDSDETVDID